MGRAFFLPFSQGFSITPPHPPQTQAAKTRSGTYPFHPLALVTVVEAVKTAASGAILALSRAPPRRRASDDPPAPRRRRLALAALAAAALDSRHAAHLAAPAALYAANGSLKLALQRHVDPTAARFVSNLKVLVVAGLSSLLLGRRFTRGQANALATLALGVSVFSLSDVPGNGGVWSPAALATAAAAVTVPALAAVLSERGLKRDPTANLAAQTFFMSAVGTILNGLALAAAAATGHVPTPPLAGAASPAALTLISANAIQGLSAAYFYRHLSTVAKKHSAVVATVGTGLLSAAALGTPLPARFWVAAALVGLATESFYSAGQQQGGKGKAPAAIDLVATSPGAGV